MMIMKKMAIFYITIVCMGLVGIWLNGMLHTPIEKLEREYPKDFKALEEAITKKNNKVITKIYRRWKNYIALPNRLQFIDDIKKAKIRKEVMAPVEKELGKLREEMKNLEDENRRKVLELEGKIEEAEKKVRVVRVGEEPEEEEDPEIKKLKKTRDELIVELETRKGKIEIYRDVAINAMKNYINKPHKDDREALWKYITNFKSSMNAEKRRLEEIETKKFEDTLLEKDISTRLLDRVYVALDTAIRRAKSRWSNALHWALKIYPWKLEIKENHMRQFEVFLIQARAEGRIAEEKQLVEPGDYKEEVSKTELPEPEVAPIVRPPGRPAFLLEIGKKPDLRHVEKKEEIPTFDRKTENDIKNLGLDEEYENCFRKYLQKKAEGLHPRIIQAVKMKKGKEDKHKHIEELVEELEK